MNRRELAVALADETKVQLNICDELIKNIVTIITKELSNGGYVKIAGFGTFDTVWRNEKTGRNPRNPKDIYIIPASNVPRFKPGKHLKEAVK